MSNISKGLLKQASEYDQFLANYQDTRIEAINHLIGTGLNKSAAVHLVDTEMSSQALSMVSFAKSAFEKVAEEIELISSHNPEKDLLIQGLSKEANLSVEDKKHLNNLSVDALIKVSGMKDPSEAWHMGEVSSGPSAYDNVDFAFQQYCLS